MSIRYRPYNPNPKRARIEDCAVRALSKALNMSWDDVYSELTAQGFIMKDMPHAIKVWGACLYKRGYDREFIRGHEEEGQTVSEFCEEHQEGTFVLVLDGHTVCAKDGCYYDTWDSGEELIDYYWRKK